MRSSASPSLPVSVLLDTSSEPIVKGAAERKRQARAPSRNGADCPCIAATSLPDLYLCKNGCLYLLRALKPASKIEPAFGMLRIEKLDAKRGRVVGRYRARKEASFAVAKVVYQEDDIWRRLISIFGSHQKRSGASSSIRGSRF